MESSDRVLFSTRSAITSTSLSLISFSVMLVLLSLVAHLKVESFLWVFLSLLVTWGLICIFLSRRIVWAAILIWIIPFLLTVFFLSTSRSRAGERLHDFTIFFGAILISLMTDFLVIAAVRFLLWRATAGRSLFALLLAIIVGLALLQVVSVIPALLATSDELNLRLHPDRRVYYRLAQGLTLLNASDLFFLLSVLLVMALLFVNHAFWPSVQRPLYALQRGGFTKTRTVAASIGVAMICSGLGLSPMLDVLRKIFGG